MSDDLRRQLLFEVRGSKLSLCHYNTPVEKYKIVISDCHLSAGRFFEGRINPHEDFYFDQEMVDFLRFFSTGEFGEGPEGPVEVELLINGDFFDFLNVPYQGEFVDAVTEEISLFKLDAIIAGHTEVMKAIREFAAKPGKSVSYLIGNHDAELFWPSVQSRIVETWDPKGRSESDSVTVIADRDRVVWEGGVEVHHGNQFEAVHFLDFEKPFLKTGSKKPVLSLPWGSFFVLNVLNYLKEEREFIDKVRPMRAFILYGLLMDFFFTVKFLFLTSFYFMKTRFVYSRKRRSRLGETLAIVREQLSPVLDLEKQARAHLDQNPDTQTVIFGHTHYPMDKVYSDGKQYINTGTWTRMMNLDWRHLGRGYSLTFAMVRIDDRGRAKSELRQWQGEYSPHRRYT